MDGPCRFDVLAELDQDVRALWHQADRRRVLLACGQDGGGDLQDPVQGAGCRRGSGRVLPQEGRPCF
eukprot:759549-Hanusia_phi.AAC.2